MMSKRMGLIISAFAMVVSIITIVYAVLNEMSIWSGVTILFCTIAIFFSYLSDLKKEPKDK